MAGRSHSARRVLGLIEWLGEGSAFVASCRGGSTQRAWPLPTVLAAATVNALAAANWQRGGGKGPKPALISIPPARPTGGTRKTLRDWREHLAATSDTPHGRGG